MRGFLAAASACLLLAACGSAPGELTGPGSLLVNTPVYSENQLFYLGPHDAQGGQNLKRWRDLNASYDVAGDGPEAVQNGDPVTIVINKAYVPLSLADPKRNSSLADLVGNRKTRDIAVLLDVGMKANEDEQAIAVWYQRNVPVDSPLNFSDLVVFSQDSWDNRVPVYFRIRLVDISHERDLRTRELLNQVNGLSPLLGAFGAGQPLAAVLNIGTRAAQLVLANNANRPLLDFTVNMFSGAVSRDAGDMSLNTLRRGGIMVMGLPFDETALFWNQNYKYDQRLTRLERQDATGLDLKDIVPAPFVLATVMTTEMSVPTVVKRRSAKIFDTLTSNTMTADVQQAVEDAKRLGTSLNILDLKERFNRFPTTANVRALVAAGDNSDLPTADTQWILSSLRTITGQTFAAPGDYGEWLTECEASIEMDPQTRRYRPAGDAGNDCLPR